MSMIGVVNILIINIIIWIGLSYFWSFWTHKLFKPWAWLEQKKRKLINKNVERLERSYKDRVRFYAYFFAMQQVEQDEVDGSFVLLGLEDSELVSLLRNQCPERTIYAVGTMEAGTYTIVRENCQGEISEEVVNLDFAPENEVRAILPESPKNVVVKGPVREGLVRVEGPIALAFIDCVDYDDVRESLAKVYPLVRPGGIITVHAYNHDWDGVRKAVDEFCAGIPEGFISLPDMYGSISIVKNKK